MDCVDSSSYQRRKASTQACPVPNGEPGPPGLHLLHSYTWVKSRPLCSRPAVCFSSSRISPSDLIASDLCWHKISVGSRVIPSEHLCCFHHRTLHKAFISHTWRQHTLGNPEGREREMDTRGLCGFIRLV